MLLERCLICGLPKSWYEQWQKDDEERAEADKLAREQEKAELERLDLLRAKYEWRATTSQDQKAFVALRGDWGDRAKVISKMVDDKVWRKAWADAAMLWALKRNQPISPKEFNEVVEDVKEIWEQVSPNRFDKL
jgi:hypothetical protein